MKKKGFTLVELLVVIAIIALLMGILMPALARVRQIAYRLYCGTNLSGIGKAMLIYSNDYDDEMPRAGGRSSLYNPTIANWRNVTRQVAFGLLADGSGGRANMTSNFYLLIKYSEVTPKSFLCKGDSGVTEFKPSDEVPPLTGVELIDLWDFGSAPQSHCSYAYHFPYGVFALTSSSEPGMAVASDPNPWQGTPGQAARPATHWSGALPCFLTGTDRESIKKGNAQTHQEDGQNVLFMDGHSSFEKSPSCGVDDDNIYTRWVGTGTAVGAKTKGVYPVVLGDPAGRTDSFLVTDGAAGGTTTTTTTR
jgi:prepilin-type N-terminal cleavage/methylation domain-containing protein/prepilin-type processing-associated H-X9-DG protein